jgi:hypothetical protein
VWKADRTPLFLASGERSVAGDDTLLVSNGVLWRVGVVAVEARVLVSRFCFETVVTWRV